MGERYPSGTEPGRPAVSGLHTRRATHYLGARLAALAEAGRMRWGVAQSAERLAVNQEVAGSTPAAPAPERLLPPRRREETPRFGERRRPARLPGRRVPARIRRPARPLLVLAVLAGCSSEPGSLEPGPVLDRSTAYPGCTIDTGYLFPGTVLDGIPSIDEPVWDQAEFDTPEYLEPWTRVIGLILNWQPYAIPHNVLWFHEIVNIGAGTHATAVTYCPLTGSSVAFSRTATGGGAFGVSGLLFQNNLVMFDREDPESRWSQMAGGAICGPDAGRTLEQVPVIEMRWDEWLRLHPRTRVLAADQGFASLRGAFATLSPYHSENYPYGAYEEVPAYWVAGAMPPIDPRRHPKERVIGLPPAGDDPGIAFPFGALSGGDAGLRAVDFTYDGRPAVLLWSDDAEGGMAYRPVTRSAAAVELAPGESGFVDAGTGSEWTVDGRAVSGPMSGERLVPIERAYVAFWGAWAAFHPDTGLWGG